jgi:hypothetical protein
MAPSRFFTFIVFAVLGVLPGALLEAQSVNPVPFVNQPLVPSSVTPGSPELALTVNGTGFISTSVVNWNGTPLATAFVNAHQLVADVPSSAVASASTSSVTVFTPGPGGGTSNAVLFTVTTLTASVAFTTSTIPAGLNPGGIVVADFNHDGKPDLAFVNQNQPDSTCYTPGFGNVGTIAILMGNGDGTFSNQASLCFPQFGVGDFAGPQLVAGDFNGDGNTDLVAAFNSEGLWTFAVFTGNGDGTFASPSAFDLFGGIREVIAADFNRDGTLDLAFPAVEVDFFSIFVALGSGDGTFPNVSGFSNFLKGFSLAAGDFNNDGILDLAVVGDSNVTILLGNGDATFTVAASQPAVALVSPASVTTGDFNGDGILDLAIADAGSSAFTVLQGNGDGTFTQVIGEPPLPDFSSFVTTSDVNGDGKLDLVFSSEPNTLSIYLGNGDGTFRAGLIQSMNYAPYGVGIGDFNGDGRLDLAVTNAGNDTVSILLQAPTAPRRVSITLASGLSSLYVDQPVTYAAVVSANRTIPTGSVVFKQGATILGTAPLAYGQASFTTTFAAAGTFPIVASYSGDQNYHTRSSNIVKQTVNKNPTGVLLSSNVDPSPRGQPVAFTAAVSSAGPVPTGKVIFKNGSTTIGVQNLVDGVATFTKSNLPRGTFSIIAIYDGDSASVKNTSQVWTQVIN